MKKSLIASLLLVLMAPLFGLAQKGQTFPEIPGETLEGKSVTLPGAARGKATLVGVAYSQKSDELLKQWISPIHSTFVDPPRNSFVPVEQYDVNIYFVALLKGIYKTVDGTITKKMKQGLQPKFHPYTVVYQGNIQDYKKQLGLGEKDLPYFFVLDAQGKILYHTSGAYNDRKLADITDAVESVK